MVDPLMRHHSEGEKDDEERIRTSEHRLAPRGFAINGSTLADDDHQVRQQVGGDKGKEERLIHAGPSEDVDCDHANVVSFGWLPW